jgi:hypothetical protein
MWTTLKNSDNYQAANVPDQPENRPRTLGALMAGQKLTAIDYA